jgi:hypothetical protein
MLLYHVTHESNAKSIDRAGLKATGAGIGAGLVLQSSCWPGRGRHVAQSHGWPVMEMVAFRVDVSRAWLSRWRWGVVSLAATSGLKRTWRWSRCRSARRVGSMVR